MDTPLPRLTPEMRARRLAEPAARVRAILDTDVANEIDDPFAIAMALLSPEEIDMAAITLAPFRREGLTASQSLDQSQALAEETLGFLGHQPPLLRGSEGFLDDGPAPKMSPGVEAILDYSHDTQDPLVIMSIGACTNVACALLEDPGLAKRATVWWLGGHAPDLGAWEYNLAGDRRASRILLDSGIPIVLFPALGVTGSLLTSLAAMEKDVEEASPLGAFLTRLVRDYWPSHFGVEKELWDLAVPAYAVRPSWFRSTLEPGRGISDQLDWTQRPEAPLWRRITWCCRNEIIRDLWQKLAGSASASGEDQPASYPMSEALPDWEA